MLFSESIKLIQTALQKPLPGINAQHLMAPKLRKSTTQLLEENPSHRLSSVLILLYPDKQHDLCTIFIERPLDNSIHSGQIAFPGGKMDDTDADAAHTALRETEEEIGISQSDVTLIGTLSQLFIPASNFLVIPYVGMMQTIPRFMPNPEEVRSLIPVHMVTLLSLEKSEKQFPTSYGNLMAPYYDLDGHAIWGATAMMISEFRVMMGR